MPSKVRSEGTDYLKATVASFLWEPSQPIALMLDDWAYTTVLSIDEAKDLVGALNEQITRLGVVGFEARGSEGPGEIYTESEK